LELGGEWKRVERREEMCAVDGGNGTASVKLGKAEKMALERVAARTMSNPDSNPTTGAELGMGRESKRPSHARKGK
jgi:Mn-containing catalase